MYVKIKNRHQLKTKDIKKFENELKKTFNSIFFNYKSLVETGDFEGISIILIENEPCFMIYKNKITFTLHGLNKYKPKENYVVVDMGAIKFITSGADVMAPGIIDADKKINKNDQVWICDEKYHKPLAVGIAIISGEQMIKEKKGRAIKTIHYVGDKLWNLAAKSL
jgi:PUA-domain protein